MNVRGYVNAREEWRLGVRNLTRDTVVKDLRAIVAAAGTNKAAAGWLECGESTVWNWLTGHNAISDPVLQLLYGPAGGELRPVWRNRLGWPAAEDDFTPAKGDADDDEGHDRDAHLAGARHETGPEGRLQADLGTAGPKQADDLLHSQQYVAADRGSAERSRGLDAAAADDADAPSGRVTPDAVPAQAAPPAVPAPVAVAVAACVRGPDGSRLEDAGAAAGSPPAVAPLTLAASVDPLVPARLGLEASIAALEALVGPLLARKARLQQALRLVAEAA